MSTNFEQYEAGIGGRLSVVRRQRAFTQGTFAAKLNVSLRTYQSYERGERAISSQALEVMASKFGVDINWLLTGCGEAEYLNEKPRLPPPIRLELFEDVTYHLCNEIKIDIEKEDPAKFAADISVYSALIYNRIVTSLKPDYGIDQLDEVLEQELAHLKAIRKRANLAGDDAHGEIVEYLEGENIK